MPATLLPRTCQPAYAHAAPLAAPRSYHRYLPAAPSSPQRTASMPAPAAGYLLMTTAAAAYAPSAPAATAATHRVAYTLPRAQQPQPLKATRRAARWLTLHHRKRAHAPRARRNTPRSGLYRANTTRFNYRHSAYLLLAARARLLPSACPTRGCHALELPPSSARQPVTSCRCFACRISLYSRAGRIPPAA